MVDAWGDVQYEKFVGIEKFACEQKQEKTKSGVHYGKVKSAWKNENPRFKQPPPFELPLLLSPACCDYYLLYRCHHMHHFVSRYNKPSCIILRA